MGLNMRLTEQQEGVLDKIKQFIESDATIFILRGYAGTGKTTMVKHIVDYVSAFRSVVLMAPTGRAARVLSEKTGIEAKTIHRTIYGRASITGNKKDDESDFKILFSIAIANESVVGIVDEASMLCSRNVENELFVFGSNNLMNDLLTFARVSSGGKLIFVGDPAQLPPVGESESNALKPDFFVGLGLKVMEAELSDVLRQTGDSVILKNAMKLRDMLNSDKRNCLVFEEKENDVVVLPPECFLSKYLEVRRKSGTNNCVAISFSNKIASQYNRYIREGLYGNSNTDLRIGDVIQVVQNNYMLDYMNGEFLTVLYVGDTVNISAPISVEENGHRVRKNIGLTLQNIAIPNHYGCAVECYILLDLLNNDAPNAGVDILKALFVNFKIRHPYLKQGTPEFFDALLEDEYYNCLKAKYGYAVTGHKCQGGEWDNVFVDYSGRTGLNDDCLRWSYTATTRAHKTLYITNRPSITPFSKFRIDEIQQCSRINAECRIIANVENSPYHEKSAPLYLHAKCRCIMANMEWTPYKIASVVSKPYLEIYNITTPSGIRRYNLNYKKGGIFMSAVSQTPSPDDVMIMDLLNNENALPLQFDYIPSDDVHNKLYVLMRSACDGLKIRILNVVEHAEEYSVIYYFNTCNTFSYIKVYIDKSGYVTYAKPMSLCGCDDTDLAKLID
jgi:hypothetical protein